ncbi:MAG: protein kinase, partial [Polyangiales bacterium]
MASAVSVGSEALPATVGGRYGVRALLGRGGMARVYRAADQAGEREVALKQLLLPSDEAARRQVEALFEREFHTLAELSHPRVIEVYDYGIDAAGPYYTMELLDGGDLRTLSPLPWQQACELIFDVCSSLALLHSRRLVHRDVSPRNVRCTRDGHAKLIDFGAMASMGAGGHVVGTPAFVAPEVLHRSTLDARTDLFSLGGTLYYTLTGRTPFAARDFNALLDAWSRKPLPPSALAPDVPKELDALVLSLLNLTPALRPRSAFEVMQRLARIAGIERDEPLSVAQAYLSTPTLVGRDRMLAVARRRMARALHGRGRGVLIEGGPGLGRSRVLDACVLEAKMLGATVLRASAAGASGASFGVAQMLGEQLLQALPEGATERELAAELDALLLLDGERGHRLRPLGAPDLQAMLVQGALLKWLLAVSKRHPLAIAVDDVHAIDETSAALLALLADKGRHHPLLVVATSGEDTAAAPVALSVLGRRSARWTLTPLERGETEQLLGSVFGDVPNLSLLSERIHAVAAGNPRTALELAQHLVDKGLICYERGVWTLPPVLDPGDLPRSAEAAARARLASLGELARFFAEVHALAFHDGLAREDYALLRPDADGTAIDMALTELLAKGVLTSADRQYVLAHRGWVTAITSELDAEARKGRHRALAALHDAEGGLLAAHHLLEGG